MLAVITGVGQMCTPKQITQHVGPSILPLGLAFPMGLGAPGCLSAEGWEHIHAKATFPVGVILAQCHLKVSRDQVTIIAGIREVN